MGKHFIQPLIIVLFLAQTIAFGYPSKNIFTKKEKLTELQLYIEDIFTGPTPTNIAVASANSTLTSPTSFGLVGVIDDPVRTGPRSDAEIVGWAQGVFAFASLEEKSIHMTFDIVFTSGEYSGSVLNLLGRNPYPRDRRELAVVGGSGAFRLARGFVAIKTVVMETTNGNAFFQCNITVLHY